MRRFLITHGRGEPYGLERSGASACARGLPGGCMAVPGAGFMPHRMLMPDAPS
ncbi:hypothetical protein NKW84_09915 [Acetobacter senegalensis]|uniref:hypothetical protein n=1 Tax=Acetobacter senegalensis TaxID=446692 RepID=UPI00209F5EC2|nr:hypothetical protein [Acetobacter senegalensis]MCP1196173.1 hypothetical protein [Acetobacter senegalensis]